MNDVAIRISCLSKVYQIGEKQKSYDRFGEQIVDILGAPFRRAGKLLRGQVSSAAELEEKIWALREVSLEIKHGEVVGIIGRNGAGKSTLLKILSRITEPTAGTIDIYGRVGSLLEVGTGFHPELTGRENIYLNGAILGMRKKEIDRKFDEIVSFAEIGKFLDTPVKYYSSGMYVRLAFSVAAHLEPEILLVDEVLAVGDLAFQRKCIGKMDDVATQGRTVLFVSHNMAILQSLCQRGIYLNEGTVFIDGTVSQAVDTYLKMLEQVGEQQLAERKDRKGEGKIRVVGVKISGGKDSPSPVLKPGLPARFEFHINRSMPGMNCNFFIFNEIGHPVTQFLSTVRGSQDSYGRQDQLIFACEVDELLLTPGRYRLDVVLIGDSNVQDYIQAASVFDVGEGLLGGRPVEPTSKFSAYMKYRWILPGKM